MDSQVNYAIVGFVVLILSGLLIASVLWLTLGSKGERYDRFLVRVQEESIAGLNKKAIVKYHGVDVGKVGDIRLDRDRPDEVHLFLDIESGTPLTEDTVATLTMQGLTGLLYVELSGGTPESKRLYPKSAPHYAEIPTNPSLYFQFDQVFRELSKDVQSITQIAETVLFNIQQFTAMAKGLVNKQNVRAVGDMLQNVVVITDAFAKRKNELQQSLVSVQHTLDNLAQATDTLPSVIQHIDQTLLTANQTVARFDTVAERVNHLLDEQDEGIGETLENLTASSRSLLQAVEQGQRDFNSFTQQALPTLTLALRDVQDLLQVLNGVSRDLQRQPNMLLLGKPRPAAGPGE